MKRTIEDKANSYAAQNFAIQVADVPSITLDISHHLRRAYIAGATESLSSQWRNVEDEKPEDGVYVLLSDGFGRFMGYYDESDHRWYGAGIGVVVCIRYWMPVPEIPNTKKI